jgi:hypothetical protein
MGSLLKEIGGIAMASNALQGHTEEAGQFGATLLELI